MFAAFLVFGVFCSCGGFFVGVFCLWRVLFALWLRRALIVACFVGGVHGLLLSIRCAGVLFTARLCHCFEHGVLHL